MSETPTPTEPKAPEAPPEPPPQTFTQEDVDRIVRKKAEALYKQRVGDVDIDALKSGAKTAEERIAALEKQVESSQREAMKRRVQAAHGISDEDADLFLTGTDEDTLTAQAKRLASRESERKQRNNIVPREGATPATGSDEKREFARTLFARGQSA